MSLREITSLLWDMARFWRIPQNSACLPVLELDSVIECDSRCVLLDATGYSDEQLNDLFLFLVEPGNYPLSNYESWGPGGIPLYTETAHSAEFAMNANYLTGNRAYHNPSFTALEKNSTALIQSSDTEAWGEVLAKRLSLIHI